VIFQCINENPKKFYQFPSKEKDKKEDKNGFWPCIAITLIQVNILQFFFSINSCINYRPVFFILINQFKSFISIDCIYSPEMYSHKSFISNDVIDGSRLIS